MFEVGFVDRMLSNRSCHQARMPTVGFTVATAMGPLGHAIPNDVVQSAVVLVRQYETCLFPHRWFPAMAVVSLQQFCSSG